MAAPMIRKKSMLVGITLAMGITMLVNAGPTVTSDATRSQFEQTSDVVTPLFADSTRPARRSGTSRIPSGAATGA